MRFNSEAYDKLFPREADPAPAVETPVETFRPSKNKVPDTPVPGDPDPAPDPAPDPVPSVPGETEVKNDDGGPGQSDSE